MELLEFLHLRVFNLLGIEVIPLHCDLDNSFPNYNPNPEDLKMLKDFGKHVLAHNADIGFAFDGDGDRVGVVDNNGHEIFADKIGLLIARNLAKEIQIQNLLLMSNQHLFFQQMKFLKRIILK